MQTSVSETRSRYEEVAIVMSPHPVDGKGVQAERCDELDQKHEQGEKAVEAQPLRVAGGDLAG